MNPSLLQAVSHQRQGDIASVAERHLRLSAGLPPSRERSWAHRLGWMLIRVGLRLLGDDARRATVKVAVGTPGC